MQAGRPTLTPRRVSTAVAPEVRHDTFGFQRVDRFLRSLPMRAIPARAGEILFPATHGKTAPETSATRAISERTAAFHIHNIVNKFGAPNKTHAVALPLRQGWIDELSIAAARGAIFPFGAALSLVMTAK